MRHRKPGLPKEAGWGARGAAIPGDWAALKRDVCLFSQNTTVKMLLYIFFIFIHTFLLKNGHAAT